MFPTWTTKSLLLLALIDLIWFQISKGHEEGRVAMGDDEGMKCVCDGGCESVIEEDCPWGLTLDVCRCCFLCARGKREPCGGVHGTCAFGLRCSQDQSPDTSKPGTCQQHRRRARRRRK